MKATNIVMNDGKHVKVYASAKIRDALDHITTNMALYDGVRLAQVLEAVYKQGCKDGARNVFAKIDDVKKLVPHRRPGRPSKP